MCHESALLSQVPNLSPLNVAIISCLSGSAVCGLRCPTRAGLGALRHAALAKTLTHNLTWVKGVPGNVSYGLGGRLFHLEVSSADC